jgi:glycosyltransferase involved in cell wall biosynthesis
MHILQIYKDYYPVIGGIENHILALSKGLIARGHQVTVLVTSLDNQDELIEQGPLTIIKAARLLHAASTPLSSSLFWHARKLRPDLVNLHFPYPPGDLVYAALANRPPLVVTYHSDIVRQRKLLQLYSPLLRKTLKSAARIIATSPNYIASSPWLAPHAARCRVVPLSTDAERFSQSDPALVKRLREQHGSPLLLFVGRLRYYKGLHILLEALPHTNAKLLIVGTGPEEHNLRALAAQYGISERAIFAGDISDEELPSYYAAADLYVLPAHLRSEAFGISLLEAQAAGLPLISCELGSGTSFANQHGETGFVVPPSDPHALARAINVLIANPELRQRMGGRGRQRARELFSPTAMAAASEAVFAEALRA